MQIVLQVNVGVKKLEDPVLEVLQFEKSTPINYMLDNLVDGLSDSNDDPCRELLNWVLPLEHLQKFHKHPPNPCFLER